MLNNENIGKRLKQVREISKFTQRRMAEMLRVQDSTYKKNEKGVHRLNMNCLDQLHDELGVSAEWLLFENRPVHWKNIQAKQDESKQAALLERDLFTEEVEEMVEMLKQVPMIRHSVMGHYQDCKIRYKDLIAEIRGSGR